jgi:hypothetical protein
MTAGCAVEAAVDVQTAISAVGIAMNANSRPLLTNVLTGAPSGITAEVPVVKKSAIGVNATAAIAPTVPVLPSSST